MYHPQIKTFVCVVDCGSFSKAAEQLYFSPVSVMKQINALEKRLGVKLMDRNWQGISLTEAGKVIYRQAKKIIELSEDARQEAIRLEKKSAKPTIRVATSLLHPSRELTRLWENPDQSEFPFAIDLVPFSDGKNGLLGIVEKLGSEIDCFVSLFPEKLWKDRCSFLPLGKYQCCCAVPGTHPLAARERLLWEDLTGQTLMLIKRGASEELDRIRDHLIRSHPQVAIIDVPYLYDASLFNRCVQMGCMLEVPEVWRGFHPSIKVIPVEGDYSLTFGVVYAKEPIESVRTFILEISKLIENAETRQPL